MFAAARFAAILLFCAAQALDCNIHMKSSDQMRQVVGKCVKTNHTFEDLWNIAPMSSESDSSSSEDGDQASAVDGKIETDFRPKRAATADNETDATTIPPAATDEPPSLNCITQCIFTQLEMTDGSGFPLHAKMVQGLLRNAEGRELRDFIQETTGDCFQEVDKEGLDACVYSQKLVQCLADRGRTNCADWPVGELPFQTN